MPAGDDRGDEELRAARGIDHLVHRLGSGLDALTAAPGRPQCRQRDRAEGAGGRPSAGGIRDGKPGAVAVLHIVEPVSAHLVGWKDAPGNLAAAHARDARG